ncbi:probable serine/threonine-protein kinase PBL9 isoform X2 [Punica granatum]|uniref:non-specific serine/threonine protein kinase n=1 Tax=Punica granatum TaxID=22663 RepID=A0A6P8DS36_PUNGR|nr:probable serine/threonine-protein kinase PBL9 isoform X2 [Punica granatum]
MASTTYSVMAPTASPNAASSGWRNHGPYIWGGLIISISILFAIAMFCCFFKRRIDSKDPLEDEKSMLRRFQMEELMKATKNFSPDCLLGSGAYGNVYRGTFNGEGTLAVKKPHPDSYQSIEEFRNEVRLLSRVKHRNLVSLVGFCEEPGARGAKILVYEFVPNGSLLEYIMGRRGRVLTWRQRVNLAIGAAKGIAHLHEGVKPSIIHRDIKPSNILIGDGFEAKVSDFGLVRSGPVEDQSHVSSQIKGTPGYLDPAYCTSCHLTPSSDVYSFGVILLQLVAARPAIEIGEQDSNYHIIEWARPSIERGNVEAILDANLLSQPCNTEVMLKMGQVGLRCVAKSPKHRPTMIEVAQHLQDALCSTNHSFTAAELSHAGSRTWVENPISHKSFDDLSSQSIAIDGVGFQKFHLEIDTISFQSENLRCLDLNSISIDVDKSRLKGMREE